MSKRIVGLDFGRKSIRAAQILKLAGKEPIIEKLDSINIPAGILEYGEIVDRQGFSALIQKLWQKSAFDTRHVAISVGSLHVFAREIDVPQMSMQRIRESLPFVLDGVLPVPADELFLDFYPIEEGVEESGLTFKGLAVAAEISHVEALVSCLEAAKLRPMVVDFAPFALLRSIVEHPNSDRLHVYIDIGAGATYFLVARGQVPLFVRILPTGGSEIDRLLASSLRITEEEAELLRMEVSLTSQAKDSADVRTATIAALQDLLTGLASTVDYYEQSHKVDLRKDCRVTLSGGVSKLKGLDSLLGDLLGMKVEPNSKVRNAQTAEGLKIKPEDQVLYILAVGLGLAEVSNA